MKTKIYLRPLSRLAMPAFCFLLFNSSVNAQNIFPSSGRAGIYTTSPAATLQVKGGARIGTLTNYLNIDSATGNLSFTGTATYRVANNQYAFQNSANPGIGLYFNATNARYEFRNTASAPTFYVGANTGNGVFIGNLKVGAYTLPATDGTNGQLLKTNGAGTLTWSNDNTSGSSGWSLTGNAGTDSSINFLGSTDAHPLAFRVNNKKSGWIDYDFVPGGGSGNTSLGYQTLLVNTTGSANTAAGYNALSSNTGGYNNTAVGASSLYKNTNGAFNTALGIDALYNNTTGSNNTAVGNSSLGDNTTGIYNTAIGNSSLSLNTTGHDNTANGNYALFFNQTGNYNTANGSFSFRFNTSGSNNTGTGFNALYSNNGDDNTATGFQSLYSNSTGFNNTATGNYALFLNTTGYANIADGYQALYSNTTGINNTVVGYSADVSAGNLSNISLLGFAATATASNQVRLGNSTVTSIGGYTNWTNISDGRVKKNIKQNVPGLAFINKLKPVTYNLDLNAADKIIQLPTIKDENNKSIQPSSEQLTSRKAKEAITYTGFVAQDVEKAAKSLNYDFSGVDAAKNDKDLYGLRYAEFVVPLVKAVQELSAKNDDLQKQIDELKAMNVSSQSSANNQQSVIISSASLDQNIPNPFANTTTINYTLPQKFATAQILITDNTGKTIKSINVSGSGKGSLNIDAATLSSGAYNYSLIVDGKLIGSKQMILAK